MIRHATPDDSVFVSAVGVAAGMFLEHETAITDGMMAGYFGGNREAGHLCIIDEQDDSGDRVAMAYVEPVRATDGTFELLMIAVAPSHQGNGRGAALVQYIEHWLAKHNQRLLLVQTSGEEAYARTRHFYSKCGYAQAARVPDYYASGVDMVMFHKSLGAL